MVVALGPTASIVTLLVILLPLLQDNSDVALFFLFPVDLWEGDIALLEEEGEKGGRKRSEEGGKRGGGKE